MQNATNIVEKIMKISPKLCQDGTKIDPKWDQDGAENEKKEGSQHKTEKLPERRPIFTEKVAKLAPSWLPKRSPNGKKTCQKINAFFDACLKPSWEGFWSIFGSKMEPSWEQSCKKIEDG